MYCIYCEIHDFASFEVQKFEYKKKEKEQVTSNRHDKL